MVNHLIHPLGDRTLCEPDLPNRSALAISVHDVESVSCSDCIEAESDKEALRASLGLSSRRRQELEVRAKAELDSPKKAEPIALSPSEVLELLERANAAHPAPQAQSEAKQVESTSPNLDPWGLLLDLLLSQSAPDGRPVLAALLAENEDLRGRFARALMPEVLHER